MKKTPIKLLGMMLLLAVLLGACTADTGAGLEASGYLSAVRASVASELSGRVVQVDVEEGQQVTVGQELFRIDSEYLTVQRDQASAALQQAEANLDAAKKQAASAQLQYELVLQAERAADLQMRSSAWTMEVEEDFRPAWYFQKTEMIEAAKLQVEASEVALANAQTALEAELNKASSNNFISAEEKLAQAQLAYTTSQQVLDQAKVTVFGLAADGSPADGDETALTNAEKALLDAAKENNASAKSEFYAALLEYSRMLTTSAADAVIQARARVAVAESNRNFANTVLMGLQTGEQSLRVFAAQAAVESANSQVSQAEAGLEQAQQALKLAEIQLNRSVTLAPMDGIVMTRSLEVGELAVAGGIVMDIAQLDTLELIVYLPEDQYGMVALLDPVVLTVDSYKGQRFTGRVIHIADEAEFTPRNVQTEEGRKATVYAVKILVENKERKLKPGMPANAEFNLP